MIDSPPGEQDTTRPRIEDCGRCGQRFPYTVLDDPSSGRFCEPCRAAMWFEDHAAVSGSAS